MRTLLWGVCALSLAAFAGAQQETQPDYVLHQDVRRVLEDVVVTDQAGHPVKDLKPGDFTLQEDGVPQQILNFTLNDSRTLSYTPPALPHLASNTYVNLPETTERGPLYVIFYDMVNMEPDSQARSREPLARMIESAPAGARIALFVNAEGLRLVQGFTTDRALLLRAINSESQGPHLPRMVLDGLNFGRGDVGATVFNFNQLAEFLSGIPGRKNLIWISSKFPLAVVAGNVPELDGNTDSVEGVRQTTAAMARAEIAVYPVSADGVVAAAGFGRSIAANNTGVKASSGGASGATVGSAGESNASLASAAQSASLLASQNLYGSYASMDVIAEATGGRTFKSNNDLKGIFLQAMEEGSTFYSLAYAPTNKKEDGGARTIRIRVNRPGLRLSYRTFYYSVPPGKLLMAKSAANPAETELAGDDEFAALEHGAPLAHDLIFSAKVSQVGAQMATPEEMASLTHVLTAMRVKQGRKLRRADTAPAPEMLSTWRVHYNFYAPAALAGARQRFELALVAYDADGHMLNGALGTIALDAVAESGPRRPVHCDQTVAAPTQAEWLRIAVREIGTARTGALEVPLPVKAPKSR